MKVQEHPVYTQLLALEISRRMPEVRLPHPGFRSDGQRSEEKRELSELLESIQQRVFYVVSALIDNEFSSKHVPPHMRGNEAFSSALPWLEKRGPNLAPRTFVLGKMTWREINPAYWATGRSDEEFAAHPALVQFAIKKRGDNAWYPGILALDGNWHWREDAVYSDWYFAMKFCSQWIECASGIDNVDAAMNVWAMMAPDSQGRVTT